MDRTIARLGWTRLALVSCLAIAGCRGRDASPLSEARDAAKQAKDALSESDQAVRGVQDALDQLEGQLATLAEENQALKDEVTALRKQLQKARQERDAALAAQRALEQQHSRGEPQDASTTPGGP